MSSAKKNHGSHHHIGRIAEKLKPSKHTFRPRRPCQGNAAYERLMTEAKIEYTRQLAQSKQRRGMIRV